MEHQAENGRPHPSSVNSIPFFRLHDNARQWLARVDRCGHMYGWSEANRLDVALCRLGDEANSWLSGVEASLTTWARFRDAFLERFEADREELYHRLAHCRQGRGESVRSYADSYRDLASQLSIDPGQDPLHMHNFLQGLDYRIRSKVFLMRPATFDQAIQDAIYIHEGLDRNSLQYEYDGVAGYPAQAAAAGRPIHGGRQEEWCFDRDQRPLQPNRPAANGRQQRPQDARRDWPSPRREEDRQPVAQHSGLSVNDLAKQMARLTVLVESYVQQRQQRCATQAYLYEPGPVSLDYAEEDYAEEDYAEEGCAQEDRVGEQWSQPARTAYVELSRCLPQQQRQQPFAPTMDDLSSYPRGGCIGLVGLADSVSELALPDPVSEPVLREADPQPSVGALQQEPPCLLPTGAQPQATAERCSLGSSSEEAALATLQEGGAQPTSEAVQHQEPSGPLASGVQPAAAEEFCPADGGEEDGGDACGYSNSQARGGLSQEARTEYLDAAQPMRTDGSTEGEGAQQLGLRLSPLLGLPSLSGPLASADDRHMARNLGGPQSGPLSRLRREEGPNVESPTMPFDPGVCAAALSEGGGSCLGGLSGRSPRLEGCGDRQRLDLRLPSPEPTSLSGAAASPGSASVASGREALSSTPPECRHREEGASMEPLLTPFDPGTCAVVGAEGGGSRGDPRGALHLRPAAYGGGSTTLGPEAAASSLPPMVAADSCSPTTPRTSPVRPTSSTATLAPLATSAATLELYGSTNPGAMASRGKAAAVPVNASAVRPPPVMAAAGPDSSHAMGGRGGVLSRAVRPLWGSSAAALHSHAGVPSPPPQAAVTSMTTTASPGGSAPVAFGCGALLSELLPDTTPHEEPLLMPFDPGVYAGARAVGGSSGDLSRAPCPLQYSSASALHPHAEELSPSSSPPWAAAASTTTLSSSSPSTTAFWLHQLHGSASLAGASAPRGKAAAVPTKADLTRGKAAGTFGAAPYSFIVHFKTPAADDSSSRRAGASGAGGVAGVPLSHPYDPGGSSTAAGSKELNSGASDAKHWSLCPMRGALKFIKQPEVGGRLGTAFVTYLLPEVYRQCRHGGRA